MSRYVRAKLVVFATCSLGLLFTPVSGAALAESRLHHILDLTLEPSSGRLQATDLIEVSGREHLALKLAPGLSIDEIALDGGTVTPLAEDGVTWITLPSAGDHRVEIAYGGILEPARERGGLSPLITADGVFLPYGIGWLANAGAEDDRTSYQLNIDVPASYKAVATGDLIDETEADGRYRATFAATRPTEPPSVFAGDYRIDERRHGELRLRTYFPAEQSALAITYLDQTAGYIDLFEDKIGAYPYDGFSIIASPLPVGLGFPGLTYVSSRILHMPFMQTRSLAHEILHNWWANGVFVDQSEGNWAEGLTTFMADYEFAGPDDEDAAWQMRLGWLRDFAALPAERDRPIRTFRSKGHDADQVIGYNKVAMVFHMLKQEIGEEAFTSGLRNFWTTHRFEHAAWGDLQASFEDASGHDLDDFFGPWLAGTGAPTLTLDVAEVTEEDGGAVLEIRLSSDRPDQDLLVPVQIDTPDGEERKTIRLTDGLAEARFDLAKRPLAVGIDQRHDLFRRLATDEAPPILRDVTLNAGTLTVIAANGSDAAAEVARTLAERTLDTGLSLANGDDDAIRTSPLMLIGLTDDLADTMARAGIAPVPDALKGQGTARSWVARRDGAPPALVVEADNDASLGALLRPLPHYGRQSFLVFDGAKVIEKGVWPTGENGLTRRFD